MRKFVPYVVTAALAGTIAFAVSYFVSHSNIVVSISDGEEGQWTKHYTGGKSLKSKSKGDHSSKRPQFWGRGTDGVEHALVKLAVAKEKGLLSEEEYEKVLSVLIEPMLGLEAANVEIDIKTTIIKSDSDSEKHDSDNDDRDDDD